MATKERNPALDVLRGLAILGVLMIHVTADYAYISPESYAYGLLNLFNKLFYWAVPTFVTLTVYLALRSGRKLGAGYVARHALPILGLYLIWSAVYLVLQIAVYGQPLPPVKDIILKYILQGGACYHLYYVVMLIQLYLVIALLSLLPIKKLRPAGWMPWAALAVQLLIQAAFIKFIILRFWFYNTAIFPIFYVLPITLGVMLAADDGRTGGIFRRGLPGWGICAFCGLILLGWYAAGGSVTFGENFWANYIFNNGFNSLFNLGWIPLMFLLAEKLRAVRPLAILGRRSLTVYFAHPLILYAMDMLVDISDASPARVTAWMAVKALVIVAVALGYAASAEKLGHKKS